MAILEGHKANHELVYYTGKAGECWISKNRKEAFDAYTFEGAKTRAKMFNEMTYIHGIIFYPVISDVEDLK